MEAVTHAHMCLRMYVAVGTEYSAVAEDAAAYTPYLRTPGF